MNGMGGHYSILLSSIPPSAQVTIPVPFRDIKCKSSRVGIGIGVQNACGYHKVAGEKHSLRYEQEEKGGCNVPCPLAGAGAGSEYSTFLRLRGAILIGGVQLKFAPLLAVTSDITRAPELECRCR